ncbi:MAG: hypothetical protein ACXVC6_00925 [Bacteroidia bacterium]
MKTQTTKTKNILMLSIIALSFLSATLLNESPVEQKAQSDKRTETISRLKKFEVKDFLDEYEHKKKVKKMATAQLIIQ